MNNQKVFLGSYLLQKDMRIRLPKQLLQNIDNIENGKTIFDIYIDKSTSEIILHKTNKTEIKDK